MHSILPLHFLFFLSDYGVNQGGQRRRRRAVAAALALAKRRNFTVRAHVRRALLP